MEKQRVLLYIHRRDVRLSDNPIYHCLAGMAGSTSATQPASPEDHSSASVQTDAATNSLAHLTLNDVDQPASPEYSRKDSVQSEVGVNTFTHLLPIYVFPANQVETSGFLSSQSETSPYPEARSRVAKVWRTGPHRVNFLAEGVWDLKERLEGLNCGSGLEVRVGMIDDVVDHILSWYDDRENGEGSTKAEITGIWMTGEEGSEEKSDEAAVRRLADQRGINFKLCPDEKYYIDDRELPFNNISELPDAYTTYRKSLEPLRKRPRGMWKTPTRLPPLPTDIPPQHEPFKIPTTLSGLTECLNEPFQAEPNYGLTSPPPTPRDMSKKNAHPFLGGESAGRGRLSHLIKTGEMSSYKETRNGMLGPDFSTKLSAYLAQGHLTARQIHWAMIDFEEGKGEGKDAQEYGKGENEGTAAVRFELLWRDYFRLLQRKQGDKMFHIHGMLPKPKYSQTQWKYLYDSEDGPYRPPGHYRSEKVREDFERFQSGRTGMGLVDASMREVFLTGYTSNRARQNVASYLARHLKIDWRAGAEWYESLLTDFDVCNNWGNWQYVSGVGNDPRQNRVFNPVKQALDYDKRGEYIKAWVPELGNVPLTNKGGSQDIHPSCLMGVYQAWQLPEEQKHSLGLRGLDWVDNPLHKIEFSVSKKRQQEQGRQSGRGQTKWRAQTGQKRDFRRKGQEEKAGRWED